MGFQIGNENLDISQLPGRKRKSLNIWLTNEYMAQCYPLAYFLSDEAAAAAEKFIHDLAYAIPPERNHDLR